MVSAFQRSLKESLPSVALGYNRYQELEKLEKELPDEEFASLYLGEKQILERNGDVQFCINSREGIAAEIDKRRSIQAILNELGDPHGSHETYVHHATSPLHGKNLPSGREVIFGIRVDEFSLRFTNNFIPLNPTKT